jgi:large subunit ribosomal protein L30
MAKKATPAPETAAQGSVPKSKITLKRSLIGCTQKQRAIAQALGLTKREDCVELPMTVIIQGMVNKIPHLLVVEPVAA